MSFISFRKPVSDSLFNVSTGQGLVSLQKRIASHVDIGCLNGVQAGGKWVIPLIRMRMEKY